MQHDDVTLCLTIGNRPELLQETLQSLRTIYPELKAIAVNDFGDDESDEVFRSAYPNGTLLRNPNKGHHQAVDLMYSHVETPYVFHCEDDWLFVACDFIQSAKQALAHDPNLTQICFRHVDDFKLIPQDLAKVFYDKTDGDLTIARLDDLHDQWYGYTFNPHLKTLESWKGLGGFSQFRKERHVSRELRQKGLHTGYLHPGPCRHIGAEQSTTPLHKFHRLNTLRKALLKPFRAIRAR